MSIFDFLLWRPTLRDLILSGSAVALGVVLGLAYWYVLRALVKRRTAGASWSGEVVLLKAVGRVPVIWVSASEVRSISARCSSRDMAW